ncbi:MAG TPA: DUF1223 domain-containing protein [Chitinophagales bacterium]|nr:DUF1223 domain-containing protein [Chitinophagales bacterium]
MPRKFFLVLAALTVLALGIFGFMKITGNENHVLQPANENGIAVIELFTSEGCSSCPPADELLSDLKTTMAGKNVFLLAFHVDYWNYLGWKDRFSDAAFSKRQSHYADVLHAEVYTPQMIVNGETVFVGSKRSEAIDAIGVALKNPATTKIQFQNGYEKDEEQVKVQFNILTESHGDDDLKDEVLNIALVQKEAASEVARGENGGKKLHHGNVVRSFISIGASHEGSAEISVPSELRNQTVTIVCYTQNKNSLEITGAGSADVFLGSQ